MPGFIATTLLVIASALLPLPLCGCATSAPQYNGQRVFASPDDAVRELAAAAKDGDINALEAIFGTDGRDVLSSGDPVADRMNRDVFALALDQGWSLRNMDDHTRELIIGHEQWPFPVPLLEDKRGWWFDTDAGREEVLARRIGRNELAAIGVLHTYVLAQREYASQGHDGKPAAIFAQKVRSDTGRHNGLYWPLADPSEPPSPLGEFAAQASAEGYDTEQATTSPRPYHGYFYQILTRQGDAAPAGAKDYIVDGEMTGGYAMIAYPAEYGNSGIMSFIVGPDGVVFESDLGEPTIAVARATSVFNPDGAWSPVQ